MGHSLTGPKEESPPLPLPDRFGPAVRNVSSVATLLDTPEKTGGSRTFACTHSTPERAKDRWRRKVRGLRSPIRHSKLARRTSPRPQPIPVARWKHETVHYEVTRALTPGWLVQGEDEQGEPLVTPGVLEVVSACGAPDASPDTGEPPLLDPLPAGNSPGNSPEPVAPKLPE